MLATHYGAHIADVKIDKDGGRDNGEIISLGAQVEPQVFAAKDAVDGEPIYLLLTPAFAYEPRHNKECYFYNDKDETGRALQISVNDDFEVSAEAITALATEPVVGQFVTWNPTTRKYVEAASAPTSGICVAEIVERKDYYFGGKVEVRYILHVLSL